MGAKKQRTPRTREAFIPRPKKGLGKEAERKGRERNSRTSLTSFRGREPTKRGKDSLPKRTQVFNNSKSQRTPSFPGMTQQVPPKMTKVIPSHVADLEGFTNLRDLWVLITV